MRTGQITNRNGRTCYRRRRRNKKRRRSRDGAKCKWCRVESLRILEVCRVCRVCHPFVPQSAFQDELLQQLASATMQLRQLAQQILHLRCEVTLNGQSDMERLSVDVLHSNYGVNWVNAQSIHIYISYT